jgi:hypothetical protein
LKLTQAEDRAFSDDIKPDGSDRSPWKGCPKEFEVNKQRNARPNRTKFKSFTKGSWEREIGATMMEM